MKEHLAQRIAALQKEMEGAELDFIIFADRENLIYYTGSLAVECMALIIPAKGESRICCLWLDVPYVREMTGRDDIVPYVFPRMNLGQCLARTLREMGAGERPNGPQIGVHKYFMEFGVFEAISKAFPSATWHAAMHLTYLVRSRKDASEIAAIKQACSFLSLGMAAAIDALEPGRRESEVLAEADYAMRKAGSEGASFRMQVLNQDRQLLAHPYATNEIIKNDQPVVIHLGSSWQGYTAKMCRTVFLGQAPEATVNTYRLLMEAQDVGTAALKDGVTAASVYDQVLKVIEKAGYSREVFLDHIGYGLGIRQSEFHPILGKDLPHRLESDMVVDILLPTIYKKDVGGPRLTDVVRVTPTGGEYLSIFPREAVFKN